MPKRSLEQGFYPAILKSVKRVVTTGLIDAQKAIEYGRVKTYWTVGQVITEAAAKKALPVDKAFCRKISGDVSRDLNVNLTADIIQRSIRFYKVYPVFPKNTPLTFTHYLALMRVADAAKRRNLEEQACRKEMSTYTLRMRVLQLNTRPRMFLVKGGARLREERGEPYVYAARPYREITDGTKMGIDCGFKIYVPLAKPMIKSSPRFQTRTMRYVVSTKTSDGYDLTLTTHKRKLIYTYAARVLRVIDGDTFEALVDAGFGICVRDHFRLKGINAPERETPGGQLAKKFLTRQLETCPFVIIRTTKAGKYGRWLVDLWALKRSRNARKIASQGVFINQLMLDHAHAGLYAG